MVAESKLSEIDDVIEIFKAEQADDPSGLLWFQNKESQMSNMLLAWTKVPIRLIGKTSGMPKGLPDLWVWLWQNYSFSVISWCDLAGIVDYRFGVRLAARIMQLRLVFPDNTLAQWVEQYITISALHEINRRTPKSSQPEGADEPPELKDDEDE